MVEMAARRIVATPEGGGLQVASLAQNGTGFSLHMHNTNSRYNQFPFKLPLEVMGPGGSLSMVLIAMPYRRDASRRVSWQVATASVAYSCDLTTTALVHRLGSGWRQQQRQSRPVSLATDFKFVFVSCS